MRYFLLQSSPVLYRTDGFTLWAFTTVGTENTGYETKWFKMAITSKIYQRKWVAEIKFQRRRD
jgi:hypothetical protein